MLNNIFMHQPSCERIPAHHWLTVSTQRLFFLFCFSYNIGVSAWQRCFFPFFWGFHTILRCWRGSKCKYFMDPLWSCHSDCQGLQSLNSPEIKKWGTAESNHFSTSSRPDLPSLPRTPEEKRWALLIRHVKYIWDVKGAFRPHSLSAAWMLHCSISSLASWQCNRKRLSSTVVNRGEIRLSLICRRLHARLQTQGTDISRTKSQLLVPHWRKISLRRWMKCWTIITPPFLGLVLLNDSQTYNT